MPLFDAFKKAFDAGDAQIEAATAQLAKLKIAMLGFASLPPAAPSAPNEAQKSEMLLAREILEHGALLSVKAMEIPAFERYVAQLKIYYSDCASTLPESQRQYPILGLNLLRLLAQNRIAEFHTELELIPTELQHANIYIKYPAQLEQHIMEGSYNKVLSAKSEGVFQKEGMYFMDMLVDTVSAQAAAAEHSPCTHVFARSHKTAHRRPTCTHTRTGARGDCRLLREGLRLDQGARPAGPLNVWLGKGALRVCRAARVGD